MPPYRVISKEGRQSADADAATLVRWLRAGYIDFDALLVDVATVQTMLAKSLPEVQTAFASPPPTAPRQEYEIPLDAPLPPSPESPTG